MGIPFFDSLSSVFPLFLGSYLLFMSFRKKHFDRFVTTYSENFAKKAKIFYRYGGVLILFMSLFPLVSSKYSNVELEDDKGFYDNKKIEKLQSNAGNKQKETGWFKGTGGNGAYSIMYPKPFREYKLPVKNNKTCPSCYSASTVFQDLEYFVEYIQCDNYDTRQNVKAILAQNNPDIININKSTLGSNLVLDFEANTPKGLSYSKSIFTIGGQYTLRVRPVGGNSVNKNNLEIFFNSFQIIAR